MSFISYAQNFEDVMLWRALKHVESGFYIDVGANDPTIDSVTKAFYERGWSGINIEPLLSHCQDLLKERPRDINLQCAAGERAGKINIWECEIRGWGTASKETIALHQQHGYKGVVKEVSVLPLSDICEKYVTKEIHFLKIDVEGLEKSVLLGMDFSKFRPWILIVEATKPGASEETYEEWESIVLDNGYSAAYTDGLNRFYVSNEHRELLFSLKHPPNVFDNFIRYEQLHSEYRAQEAEAKLQKTEAKLQKTEAKLQKTEAKLQKTEAKVNQINSEIKKIKVELHGIYDSHSWRVTAPLRYIMQQARLLKKNGFKKTLKAPVKKLVFLIVKTIFSSVNARPELRKSLVLATKKIGLYDKLKLFYYRVQSSPGKKLMLKTVSSTAFSRQELTPRARQIYLDLKAAIDSNKV